MVLISKAWSLYVSSAVLMKYSVIFISLFITAFANSSLAGTDDKKTPIEYNGFIETRLGVRIMNDPDQKEVSIGEIRLQLDIEKDFDEVTFNLVTDLVYDPVINNYTPDYQNGGGVIDLRQMNVSASPLEYMDIKIGRQILTWGTGDLLFINDLFAKDWNSFLIGRDVEYLKAPTDAIKVSLFHDLVNIDVVYIPRFSSDRFIDGQRISFFDRTTNTSQGRNQMLTVEKPNNAFSDDELSLRFFRSIGANEVALYYYHGFWKSPAGVNAATGNAIFPPLSVWGLSIRGPIAGGIGNVETGRYQSEANAATDALSRNNEYRILIGYERELATNLTGAIQYYLERKQNYSAYVNSLPPNFVLDDKNRQVITMRLSKHLLQQNMNLSIFNFFSPTDKDGYVRITTFYKVTDTLKVEGGINYLYGKNPHTFYAQFEKSSNIYISVRYGF